MKRRILCGFLALIVVLGIGIPALAQVKEPSVLSINEVRVFRNSLELLDQLYLVTYELDYDPLPTYGGVNDTFLIRLMNAGVELGGADLVPFFRDGYDIGLAAIYFDAAGAPAWLGAYDVDFMGMPTLHWMDTTAVTAMASAQADDGGVLTDETAAANDAVVNDMNLLPNPVVVNDAYYFGADGMFDILTINIGTQGAWVGTYDWEYWNGSVWKAVSALTDGTIGFTAAPGYHDVTYTVPEDWQTATVNGVTAFYLRFRVVSRVAPGPAEVVGLGTQCWTNALAVPPATSTAAFAEWYDGTTVSATRDRLTARIRAIAQAFENDWGGTTDLIEEVAGDQKLTDEGEQYFTAVIPGLRTMCPALFGDILSAPDFPEKLMGGSSCVGGDDSDYDVFGANAVYAQTFTPDQDETLNGGRVKAFSVGVPGAIIVSVRATLAGVPVGADLAAGTVSANNWTTNTTGGWYEVTFAADLDVVGGTTYALALSDLGGNAANYVGWRANSAGTCDGGAYFWNGFVWAAIPGEDFSFQTSLREGFTGGLQERLAAKLVGTKFDMTRLGTSFGMSRMWMSSIVWLIFGVALPVVLMVRGTRTYKAAFLFTSILLVVGAWLGFMYLVVAVLAAFLSGAAGIYVFFFSRSG